MFSLSSRADVNYTFFLLAYARAKRAVDPVNKGLPVSFLCSFFVSVPKTKYREIKHEITTNFNR